MAEVDEFLAAVLPRLTAAETALHDGDPGPRAQMWAHTDPVTLFGAAMNGRGWDQVGPVFDQLASRFSDCESYEYDVIAAGASGDLGYVVGVERTSTSFSGEPMSYSLRTTTVFRREGGEWKVVHRHGDPVLEGAASSGPIPAMRRRFGSAGSAR